MDREVQLTKDGSTTIFVPQLGATYHNRFGAIQETEHIFINAGLLHYAQQQRGINEISIFEIGLGTGLNAALTAVYAQQQQLDIHYHAVEPYPLTDKEVDGLNYSSLLPNTATLFNNIHRAEWGKPTAISNYLTLTKHHTTFENFGGESKQYDIIYHDAFSPQVQPELWNEQSFLKLYNMLKHGGTLITYCSKSTVRRTMQAQGFTVEKLAGPIGKREILRATKH